MALSDGGRAYLGDLCYVLREVWEEACELMFSGDGGEEIEGEFTLKDGRSFHCYGTKNGDGEFAVYDQSNDRVGKVMVDGGNVGVILLSDIAPGNGNRPDFGLEVDLQPNFHSWSNDKGNIGFDGFIVKTGYDVSGDDEDEDEDDED